MKPVFHSDVRAALNRTQHNVVVLAGPKGRGHRDASRHLISNKADIDWLERNGRIVRILDGKIEEIRNLHGFLAKKYSDNGLQRVIIVELSAQLSDASQNALLKIIEELSANTLFIMQTHSITELLPTVLSRAQVIQLVRPTLGDFTAVDPSVTQNSYLQSDGSYELIGASNTTISPRQFLGSNTIEKVMLLESLASDRSQTELFLEQLLNACQAAMRATSNHNKIQFWYSMCVAIDAAVSEIERNASPKLALLKLAML